MVYLFYLLSFIWAMLSSATNENSQINWIKMESDNVQKHHQRVELAFEVFPSPDTLHTCTFHLVGKNEDLLEKFLLDSSDPQSPNYGKHMSKDEIQDMTMDTDGIAKITKYLSSNGAVITMQTSSSLTAEAPINSWEKILNTTFFLIKFGEQEDLLRAKEYSLPEEIAPHVRTVLNTVQLPVKISRGPVIIGLNKMNKAPEQNNA